ncbi:hypothetical protein LCGC14_2653730, partial [marine sediment metagenome]
MDLFSYCPDCASKISMNQETCSNCGLEIAKHSEEIKKNQTASLKRWLCFWIT